MAYEGAKTNQAKSLRLRMTSAERKLWSRLRAHRFHGLVWLRQEPFGKFIVDFYCPVARLVVELDGEAHGFTTREDAARQAWIEEQGAKVIRFPNWLVLTDMDTVMEVLLGHCAGHLNTTDPPKVDSDRFE